jgi:hypothetical protein
MKFNDADVKAICFAKDPDNIGCYITAMKPIKSMCQAHANALGWLHYTVVKDYRRRLYQISEY